MKNFILASSLAALAAGKATTTTSVSVKSMPGAKSNTKTIRNMVDTERRNIRKASKADAKVAKSAVMEAKTVAKEEGAVFSESHSYADFFELSQGESDCSSTVGRVVGFEAYRCMDYVIADGDGMAMTESEMMIKPNNYGFPIFYFFDGHGCREENIIGHWRMPKTEFGFPPEYTGGCMPMFDGPSPTTATAGFYQEAMWTYMRHEPMYPAVMQGIDGKDKGCRRGKYNMYEVIAAGLCRNAGDDDSSAAEYSYFDVSNCYLGEVEEKFFSDPYCSTTMTRSETIGKEECVFDVDEFKMYLMEEGDAALEYRSRLCTYGAP